MMKYCMHFIACLLALWMACYLFPLRAGYSSFVVLVLGAAILSLLYRLLRPVLQLVGSPVSLLTCGLFVFVINGLLVKLTAAMLGGLWLHGFWLCVGIAVIIAVLDIAMQKLGRMGKQAY